MFTPSQLIESHAGVFHQPAGKKSPSQAMIERTANPEPQAPKIVLPVAAFQQDNRSRSICNAFSRAVRDLSYDGADPNPRTIKQALEITFHKMASHTRSNTTTRHDIMQTLVKSGLEAPKEAMPQGFEAYAVNTGSKTIPTGAFGRAMTGMAGKMRDTFMPPPAFAPAGLVCHPT